MQSCHISVLTSEISVIWISILCYVWIELAWHPYPQVCHTKMFYLRFCSIYTFISFAVHQWQTPMAHAYVHTDLTNTVTKANYSIDFWLTRFVTQKGHTNLPVYNSNNWIHPSQYSFYLYIFSPNSSISII